MSDPVIVAAIVAVSSVLGHMLENYRYRKNTQRKLDHIIVLTNSNHQQLMEDLDAALQRIDVLEEQLGLRRE